jgi:hypothetical protein
LKNVEFLNLTIQFPSAQAFALWWGCGGNKRPQIMGGGLVERLKL